MLYFLNIASCNINLSVAGNAVSPLLGIDNRNQVNSMTYPREFHYVKISKS